ncbi:hypothetical protein [Burkholderia stagnalis]|uniref:hypothetical protein n=1 Tax=Burkholderia stagnalis TaxID=1503054 RepID=UPI00075FD54F|nr:hypothetical protein [Burkholderia stagnalis]KWK70858.1 hypothetical protein WT82_11515 [Burkholderia stagnalis]
MRDAENRSKDSGQFISLWELFGQIGQAETALVYEAAGYLVSALEADLTGINDIRSRDASGVILPLDMGARLQLLSQLRLFADQGTLFDADGTPNDDAQPLFERIGFYVEDIYPFLLRHDVAVVRPDEMDSDSRRFPDGRHVPGWIRAYDGKAWISHYRATTILIAGTSDAGVQSPAYDDVFWKWKAAMTDGVERTEIAATTISGKQMLLHTDIRSWCARHGYAWPLEAPAAELVAVAADETSAGGARASEPGITPRPLQQQAFQEQEILRVLAELGHDPLSLRKSPAGQPGVKAEVRKTLNWQGSTTFDKAWERLRRNKEIADAR